MAIAIAVPQARAELDTDSGQAFVAYCIECHSTRTGERLSSCWRRFREFEAINRCLRAAGVQPLRLPRKTFGPADVERRRVLLEYALRKHVHSQRHLSRPLLEWLMLPAHLHPIYNSEPVDADAANICKAPAAARYKAMTEAHRANIKEAVIDASKRSRLVLAAMSVFVMALSLRTPWDDGARMLLLGVCCGLLICSAVWFQSARRWRAGFTVLIEQAAQAAKELGLDTSTLVGLEGCGKGLNELGCTMVSGTHRFPLQDRQAAPEQQDSVEGARLPPALQKEADHAMELLELNLQEEHNCEGQMWETKDSGGGIAVSSSAIPGTGRRMWKSRVGIPERAGLTMHDLASSVVQWEERLRWDKSVSEGKVVKKFEGGYDLVSYRSSPAAGGAISAREFFDIRKICQLPGEGAGVMIALMSVTTDQMPDLPPPGNGIVRACSQPGGGMRITRTAQGGFVVETIGCIDIKGWVPVKVINLAMSGTLKDMCKAMRNHLADAAHC